MHDVTLRRLQMFYYAISNRRSSYQPLLFACRVSASYQQSINALRDRSIITSRFFLYFLTPSPLSLVVTLLTTPPPKITSHSFNPRNMKKMYESESDSFHSQYCYTELILRISYSSVHGDDRWSDVLTTWKSGSSWCMVSELLNTCSK